jgi:hypothetical protein
MTWPEGRLRWEAAGSPPVPAVVLDGVAHSFLTIAQLARHLDLAGADDPGPDPYGDVERLLRSWSDCVRATPWAVLVETIPAPTARPRTPRFITLWMVRRCDRLLDAWDCGDFAYAPYDHPETDAATKDLLLTMADRVIERWSGFRPDGDRPIREKRAGDMPFSELVAFQRIQVAYQYRQLVDFLRPRVAGLPETIDLRTLEGLRLPRALY